MNLNTRTLTTRVVMLLVFLWTAPALAQDGTDTQVRLAFHKQPTVPGWSLVGWAVLPDLASTNNKGEDTGLTSLNLVGIGRASKPGCEKCQPDWVEFLVGTRANQRGPLLFEPTFNLRGLRKIGEWSLYGEAHLYPRGGPARTISFFSADMPVASSSIVTLRAGAESEIVNRFHGPDSWGVGPRASLVFRSFPHLGARKIALTVAYQFRNNRNFLRWYIVFLR